MKQSAPIKAKVHEMKPMTPEERKEQAARAYMQKRESIATGVLFNLMHNQNLLDGGEVTDLDVAAIADFAIGVADKFIEKLYFSKDEE